MKNLPMDLLRSFVSVAQLNSITKAGELLGRSQPAITLQMQRLEELVDETLLTRNGKNMDLSEAGDRFYEHANQILSLNDLAVTEFSKSAVTGKIRLGIPSEFATVLLPKIVSRFAKAYPNVTLEVNCELSKNLLTKTGKANHDLILALQDDPNEKDSALVKTDPLVWVAGSDMTSQKVSVVPLIVASQGCIYRNRAIRMLDKSKQPWQIVYTNPDLTGIQYAIQEGLGVTVLAKSTVPDNLKILRPSPRFPELGDVGISLLFTGRHRKNEALQLLAEYLKTGLA
ncbi:MAG: LysR family transcriptional regulator [Porticoccaceae bacterium]|jgi:DNA-binding transcriptional LysR family regulator|nr:LysR family transcriptional regulator [Porticoccaceae bacterium]MBT4163891.1 LysR family transcriptional regulator [Porticoccaceae bacterium]MBT4590916.1 LysR family transcriptional regulator [Porticoccaceae bacterium]MBT5003041.1 LysR family transcriptional regulator [Porticoccaceae bacterium]MBT5102965.1 LysR family transcriptional regulator [Porticoccaceae bacterium]